MSYEQSTVQGDVLQSFRTAIVYGTLWAIGSSWATAIREVVLLLVPEDDSNRALAELGSAGLTTVFGITLAILATRTWCAPKKTPTPPRAPLPAPLPHRRRPPPVTSGAGDAASCARG
jgi:hypothetical protein